MENEFLFQGSSVGFEHRFQSHKPRERLPVSDQRGCTELQ